MFSAACKAKTVKDILHGSLQIVLLYCLVSGVLAMEMCTKSVPVQQEPTKKVHVLRRVPASCSNWEKAWSWISKKDCGTKYRLDLVDVPSKKVVTYRMKKVCCEGDTKCKQAEADRLAKEGMEVSDEKFLAIILGSTAAAVFVIVVVISISLCRKKRKCPALCEERRHIYTTAEDVDDSSELQDQKSCAVLEEQDTETKPVCESEYAEITDSGLPRYADIFKGERDAFSRATAPPISTYESRRSTEGQTHLHQRATSKSGSDETHRAQDGQQQQRDVRAVITAPDCGRRYCNVGPGEGAETGGRVREEPMLNLTKDDPAVVTAMVTAPSPSDSDSPLAQTSTTTAAVAAITANCDVDVCHRSQLPTPKGRDKPYSATAQYETLTEQGAKDCHDYQRLLSKEDKESISPIEDRRSSEERREVVNVHREDSSAPVFGQTEAFVEC